MFSLLKSIIVDPVGTREWAIDELDELVYDIVWAVDTALCRTDEWVAETGVTCLSLKWPKNTHVSHLPAVYGGDATVLHFRVAPLRLIGSVIPAPQFRVPLEGGEPFIPAEELIWEIFYLDTVFRWDPSGLGIFDLEYPSWWVVHGHLWFYYRAMLEVHDFWMLLTVLCYLQFYWAQLWWGLVWVPVARALCPLARGLVRYAGFAFPVGFLGLGRPVPHCPGPLHNFDAESDILTMGPEGLGVVPFLAWSLSARIADFTLLGTL